MSDLQQLLNTLNNTSLDDKQNTKDIMKLAPGRHSPTAFIRQRKDSISTRIRVANSKTPTVKGNTLACIQQQIPTAKGLQDASTSKIIDQLIEAVIGSHMSTCNYTAEKYAAGKRNYEASSYAQRAANMASRSMEMMKDGPTPSKMWAQMVKQMEPVMTRVITFTKGIPGFQALTQNDQEQLIKQGSFEVVLARYSRLFEDSSMFLPTMDVKLPRALVKYMPCGSLFEEQFKFCSSFNPLHLEDGELALLSAVMIVCPERDNLDDEQQIFELQGLLLQALYTYMKRLRPDNFNGHFTATLNTLPAMEHVNDLHTHTLKTQKLDTPALHKDIFLS